jgi:hypothetical protein
MHPPHGPLLPEARFHGYRYNMCRRLSAYHSNKKMKHSSRVRQNRMTNYIHCVADYIEMFLLIMQGTHSHTHTHTHNTHTNTHTHKHAHTVLANVALQAYWRFCNCHGLQMKIYRGFHKVRTNIHTHMHALIYTTNTMSFLYPRPLGNCIS